MNKGLLIWNIILTVLVVFNFWAVGNLREGQAIIELTLNEQANIMNENFAEQADLINKHSDIILEQGEKINEVIDLINR